MRLLVLVSPRSTTSPPRPPSPPLGPPHGSYFSRRKETQPRPPSPAPALMTHSSTNIGLALQLFGFEQHRAQLGAGPGELGQSPVPPLVGLVREREARAVQALARLRQLAGVPGFEGAGQRLESLGAGVRE